MKYDVFIYAMHGKALTRTYTVYDSKETASVVAEQVARGFASADPEARLMDVLVTGNGISPVDRVGHVLYAETRLPMELSEES